MTGNQSGKDSTLLLVGATAASGQQGPPPRDFGTKVPMRLRRAARRSGADLALSSLGSGATNVPAALLNHQGRGQSSRVIHAPGPD